MSKTNDGLFFLQWVTVVTVSMTLAILAALGSMWSVGEVVEEAFGETAAAFVGGGFFGALMAGITAAGQAVVMIRQGINPVSWIVATLIAGTLGMAIGMTVALTLVDVDKMPEALLGLHFGLSAGVPIGQVQSKLLKKHVTKAKLWILICAVAFALGFVVGLPLSGEGREWLVASMIAGTTAIVSGAGLVWLRRREGAAVLV